MGWLDFKWWIRDNITDPIGRVIGDKVNSTANAAQSKLDDIKEGGDKVIDAVFNPVGTANKAVDYVKENPDKVLKAAVAVTATVATSVIAKNLSTMSDASGAGLMGLAPGKNKPKGEGHDHRGNRGPHRTPAQKRGDKARRKQ